MQLKRLNCNSCGRVDVGRNKYGQLYIVCDCPDSERSIKVDSKTPESWE